MIALDPAGDRFGSPFEGWEVNSYRFGERCQYPNEEGKMIDWGTHAGADCNTTEGITVCAIQSGICVYSGEHPGKSKDSRNWGGIIIIQHVVNLDITPVPIYSVYGHLSERKAYLGEGVAHLAAIGTVAPALTAENGWWEDTHLHLGILLDPEWKYPGGVLPGYVTDKFPYQLEDWINPEKLVNHSFWQLVRA